MQTKPYTNSKTSSASFSIPCGTTDPGQRKHQVTVSAGTATTGTVALKFKAFGSDVAQPVYNPAGVAIVLTITSGSAETVEFDAWIGSYEFTLAGTNGTVTADVVAGS